MVFDEYLRRPREAERAALQPDGVMRRAALLQAALRREDETLQLHPTDQHSNDLGHRLVAEGPPEHLAPP